MQTAEQKRRLRGVILKLIYENQEEQKSRLDDLSLHAVLDRLDFDLSRNDLRTLLQDLAERSLIGYAEEKNLDSGKVSYRRLRITPAGRDVVEGTEVDAGVKVE